MKAAQSGYVEMILFSINPAFDMLPASEDIDTMFAEEFDAGLKETAPDRTKLYRTCEENDVGITVMKGFAGDSISILLNDSVLADRRIGEEPFNIEVKRFAEQSALMIVDKATDRLSLFELSEKGGNYRFEKDGYEVKLLAQ